MLKQLPSITLNWLLHILNLRLKARKLPRNWKMASVISIIKLNKPEDKENIYKPISLTSTQKLNRKKDFLATLFLFCLLIIFFKIIKLLLEKIYF